MSSSARPNRQGILRGYHKHGKSKKTPRKSSERTGEKRVSKVAQRVKKLTCGEVMVRPKVLPETASVLKVLRTMTNQDLDHIFIVDREGIPVGRIHAVDVLKLISRKSVNRDVVWMEATSVSELINHPPLHVKESTPLLAAAALMLTHDLNQLAVVGREGVLSGCVSNSTVARHLPKFLL